MVRSRLGLKALGLCALVLGLMAMATGSAQAETGAKWSVKNLGGTLSLVPGATDLLPEVQIKELENNTATLLFTTGGGTKVEILCTSAQLVPGISGATVKLQDNGGLSPGKARFHGCLTRLNGAVSKPCEPFTGASKGLIESLEAKGLMVLHELAGGVKDVLTRLTPVAAGGVFAHIALGEECAIGEEVLVTGSLFLKDSENTIVNEKVDRLISQGPLTSLTALGQPAHITGSALARLIGPHLGFAWGGLPA